MKRNVQYNGLGSEDTKSEGETAKDSQTFKPSLGKVRVNEGDAW